MTETAHGGEHADDEEDVQQQGEVSDQTGAAVVQEHVDDNQDEGTEEGEQTGTDRFLTQRRSYDFGLDDVDAGFKVTGVQHGGEVLSLFDGEVAGDFRVTVRNLAAHGRCGIDELVKHDGDAGRVVGRALGGSLAGDFTPLVGSLVFHRHVDDHAVVLIDILTGVAHHAVASDGLRAQQGSDTVVFLFQRIDRISRDAVVELLGGTPVEDDVGIAEDSAQFGQHLVDLRHVSLSEVGDDVIAGGDSVAEDGAFANFFFLIFVFVLIGGFGVFRCSQFRIGVQGSIQSGVGFGSLSLRSSFLLVLQFNSQFGVRFSEALLDGLAAHHVVIDFPEFQFCGALQQVGDTLGFLHTGKLHEDTAALQHLQVGLSHTETVDTGTQDLERAVHDFVALLADVGDDLVIGGVLHAGTLAEVGAEVGIVEVQRLLLGVEVLHENIDKVAVDRLCVFCLSFLKRIFEQLVVRVGGQALHSVRHGNLQGHVHTALQVQAQVQLFVLTLFVSVSEING